MPLSWNTREKSNNNSRGSIDITQIQILNNEEIISNDPPPWTIGVIVKKVKQILNREEGWKPSKLNGIFGQSTWNWSMEPCGSSTHQMSSN